MLGIIGGTGLYNIEGLNVISEDEIDTPYGAPSAPLMKAEYAGQELIFLARHGKQHQLMPHEVNYRANIWALKSMSVKQLVGVSAVGSLREELKPGAFVIPDQYFDFVKGAREKSFFGEGLVAHVSTATVTCSNLTQAIKNTASELDMELHTGKAYACVDGPRLGTQVESHFLRNAAGCDIVGMTNVPEAFLAREAQICYCVIGIVTDYDCWKTDTKYHVTVEAMIARYGKSIESVTTLLKDFLEQPRPEIDAGYRECLSSSILTPEDALTPEKKKLLALLRV